MCAVKLVSGIFQISLHDLCGILSRWRSGSGLALGVGFTVPSQSSGEFRLLGGLLPEKWCSRELNYCSNTTSKHTGTTTSHSKVDVASLVRDTVKIVHCRLCTARFLASVASLLLWWESRIITSYS